MADATLDDKRYFRSKTNRSFTIMATRTTIALVVALVMFAPTPAMAHKRTVHPRTTHSYITTRSWIEPWAYRPGYASTLPAARGPWGWWECVTDEGQGRFLPCEMQ
jgi:hypothetical protein